MSRCHQDDLSLHIARLYPLRDKKDGIRYRIVDELGGTTELEATNGQPRYVPTRALENPQLWDFSECEARSVA